MPKNAGDKELRQEIDELTADLKRVQADFVNFRRRTEEERGELMAAAKAEVLRQILPLLDNVERALAHLPEDLADHEWARGVAQIARQAEDTLKRLGAERIEALGATFDPYHHEAVSYEDGEGEQVVTEEMQAGYKHGDRVLRPAVVRVGHQPKNKKKEK